MISARINSGWQTLLTDLSLVLFLFTAAALNLQPDQPKGRAANAAPALPPPPLAPPALGDPVAVWRAGAGAPDLRHWLQSQPSDARLRLTIVASIADAQSALSLAASAGQPARILLESEAVGTPFAALTYDQPAALARGLQRPEQQLPQQQSAAPHPEAESK